MPKLASSAASMLAALALMAGSAAHAQSDKPDNTPENIIAATQTCIEVFIDQPDPASFVPEDTWEFAERMPNSAGVMPPYHRVEHRFEKIALHYVPKRGCAVFASLPDQRFDRGDATLNTAAALINGLRDAAQEEHDFKGFRLGDPDGFILATVAFDAFEIDVQRAPPTPLGSYYIIKVHAPEAAPNS